MSLLSRAFPLVIASGLVSVVRCQQKQQLLFVGLLDIVVHDASESFPEGQTRHPHAELLYVELDNVEAGGQLTADINTKESTYYYYSDSLNYHSTGDPNIKGMIEFDGKVFFSAEDGTHVEVSGPKGVEQVPVVNLYSWDGTSVQKECGGLGAATSMTALGSKLYFKGAPAPGLTAPPVLMVFDPSTTQCNELCSSVVEPRTPVWEYQQSTMAAANGKLYFPGRDSAFGDELWSYNPDDDSCTRVSDVRTGSTTSDVDDTNLAVIGHYVYFSARADTPSAGGVGEELHKYDTRNGAISVACDADPGGDGSPVNLFVAGDPPSLYFKARTPEHGTELWKYDPDTQSCAQLCDLRPGSIGSGIDSFTWFKSKLWMIAKPGGTSDLFRLVNYDPASGECNANIYDGNLEDTPNAIVSSASHLYMFQKKSLGIYEVVRTDGELQFGQLTATTIFSTTNGNFQDPWATPPVLPGLLVYSYDPSTTNGDGSTTNGDGTLSGMYLTADNARVSFGPNGECYIELRSDGKLHTNCDIERPNQ